MKICVNLWINKIVMPSDELEKWERQMRLALDEADAALERKYGSMFTRRPNRPEKGTTVNPMYDGLFSLDAKFSLGISTQDGPGYTVDLRTSCLEYVSSEMHQQMLLEAAVFLDTALKKVFPGKQLAVTRKGNILRITGDMDFK